MFDTLTEEYKQSGGSPETEKALLEFMETDEYYNMPYHLRNKGWITSSKLKDYSNVPLFAYWRHIEGRSTAYDDKDALTIGSAIDDRLTRGEDYYNRKYAVVARRNSTEAKDLAALGSTLLTGKHGEIVDSMKSIYSKHPLFPKEPKKRHLIWLAYGKYPCKAELDHEDFDRLIFGDIKTTASLPKFNSMVNEGGLDIQMGFYFGGILEKFDLKCECELYVMDKHDWTRAHVWKMTVPYLEATQGRVNSLLNKWIESEETEIWEAPDTRTWEGLKALWSSPFYDQWSESLNVPPTIL